MADKGSANRMTVAGILDYFLGLYKVHLGAGFRDLPGKAVPVETSRHNPRLVTYDLLVDPDGAKLSRRVTVGPIAEDAGSKSTCFLAIYDSKLVIKIPPKPITDFKEYIRCIEKDRKIAAALSPRECLIPGVSMILDKIYKFPRGNELKGNQREDIYFEWLQYNREYQRYLQIGGSYVFFMDLSRHMFLSEVMSLFHDLAKKMQEEITRDPSVLDSFEKFEGRYGFENTQIGVELKEVYSRYDNQVRRLMMQTGVTSSGMLYKTQSWFFNYLAGIPAKTNEEGLTDARAAELNRLLSRTVEDNQAVLDEYRVMIRCYLQRTCSSRHRHYQEGLAVGILDMLAWIRNKGVAVRDIKPDNLLLVGDPNNYPLFLANPEMFSVGLIDLETAVVFQSEKPEAVEQPLLGGTFLYASPLSLLNNRILLKVYGDLPRSLYFQDWYAVVGMIYRIFTGLYLFPRTAQLMPEVAGVMMTARQSDRPAEEIVGRIKNLFWSSAVSEFKAGLRKQSRKLQSLRIWLPEPARRMFLEDILVENRRTEKWIKYLINRQELFKSRENREQLYAAPPERIAGFMKKAETNAGVAKRSLQQLERIRRLKVEVCENRVIIQRLEAGDVELSVQEVLEFMFNRVLRFVDSGLSPVNAETAE